VVLVNKDVSLRPEEDWDVDEDRGEEREPQPEVLAEDAVVEVARVNPAPILFRQRVSKRDSGRVAWQTYRGRVDVWRIRFAVNADTDGDPEN
jgi:hypothetical protein